jgi:hypothetical protein
MRTSFVFLQLFSSDNTTFHILPLLLLKQFFFSLSVILKMVATVRYAKMLKTASAYKTARHQKLYLNALACHPLESLSWN